MGLGFAHDSQMRPRDILAANINALMAEPEPISHAELVKASGVSNGTLGRIRNAQVATTMDQLEGLARGLKVEPWELLTPPDRRKALRGVSEAIKAATKPSRESDDNTLAANRKRAGARS